MVSGSILLPCQLLLHGNLIPVPFSLCPFSCPFTLTSQLTTVLAAVLVGCLYKGSIAAFAYTGFTVRILFFKSYKQKKQLKNDSANWQIFENTHEAIIDQETFDIVQRIRYGRCRWTPMGEMPNLSGMVFCADCGAKMYQVRGRSLPQSEYMVCVTCRKKGKDICPSHQIRNSVIEKYLLVGIREITGYVQANEDEFVEIITKKSRAEIDRSLRDGKRELEQSQARSTSWTRLSSGSMRTTSRVRFPMSVLLKCQRIMKRSRKCSNVGWRNFGT